MLGINMGDMSIVDMIKPLFGLFEGDFDFPVVISSVLEPLMGMFTGQLKMLGIDLDAIMPEVYIKILILFKMNDVWYLKSSIKKLFVFKISFQVMNLVNSLMMTNWEKDVDYPYVVDKVP